MDNESPHREIRLAAGNRDAIVFVHGILGSPVQFNFLAEQLHPTGFDCLLLLLPGHGGTANAFSQSTGKAWQEHVDKFIDETRQKYRRVFIVGHSLGGLLSLNYVTQHEISGIVLLNTPLFFKLSFKQILFSARILFSNPIRDDDFLAAYRLAFSVVSGKIYDYPLWVRQFASLYFIAQKTKKMLGEVKAPTLVIQSAKDESVGRRSAAVLSARLPKAMREVVALPESYHCYFAKGDIKIIFKAVSDFVQATSAAF